MDRHISLFCGVTNKDSFICVGGEPNAIWEIDAKEWSAYPLAWLDDNEILSRSSLFISGILVDDVFFLAPARIPQFAAYDISRNKLEKLNKTEIFDKWGGISNIGSYFYKTFYHADKIYMVGCYYPCVAKIDPVTFEIEIIKMAENVDRTIEFYYLPTGVCMKDSTLYLPRYGKPEVVTLNLLTGNMQKIKAGPGVEQVCSVISVNNELWYMVKKGDTYSLTSSLEGEEGQEEILVVSADKTIWWWDPIAKGNSVFFLQSNGIGLYRVNINRRQTEVIKEFSDAINAFEGMEKGYYIRCPGHFGDSLYICNRYDNKWYEYNVMTGIIRQFYLDIDKNAYETSKCRLELKKSLILKEGDQCLKNYINAITGM